MPKGIWVGTIEISYFDHEASGTRKNAFTVVTTWASSAEEFRQKCELMLESYRQSIRYPRISIAREETAGDYNQLT
jgi:hypothetical protein